MKTKTPKPYAPTILKRSTAGNLHYLTSHSLIAPIDGTNLVVAASTRKRRKNGTFTRGDTSPTCGV